VVNVIGKREQPIQNFAIFDGDSLEGRIYSFYTPEQPALGFISNMTSMSHEMPLNGNGLQSQMPNYNNANLDTPLPQTNAVLPTRATNGNGHSEGQQQQETHPSGPE
jgi:ubiquitin-like 1-activating enzyme E1 A